ncbi:GNAT family N-acetyltransferase [Brevundimonas sp.]|uniref:GNAT family N-acetyltransferase n=1 Tax=Brevundimonas sp. TaxID=1871086 RepID=UPI0039183BC3
MVVLHLLDADDAGLIAALQGEGLPEPGAGRYFRADDDSALAGYVGLEGEGRDLLLRSLVVLAGLNSRGLGSRILSAAEAAASELGGDPYRRRMRGGWSCGPRPAAGLLDR